MHASFVLGPRPPSMMYPEHSQPRSQGSISLHVVTQHIFPRGWVYQRVKYLNSLQCSGVYACVLFTL